MLIPIMNCTLIAWIGEDNAYKLCMKSFNDIYDLCTAEYCVKGQSDKDF